MGMTVGNRKGSLADPNVVPLIDILLVLIIIFMVITPTVTKGHKALLPQPPEKIDSPPPPDEKTEVVVQVLSGGTLKINNELHTWASLGPRLADIFKRRAAKVAFVKGDDSVLFQEIARAIDIMRSSGVDRIGLLSANMAEAR